MSRSGFALIGALWLTVFLAVLGLQFSLESSRVRAAAMRASEYSLGEAAAGAGIEQARVRLELAIDRSVGLQSELGAVQDAWADPGRLVADSGGVGQARYNVRAVDPGTRVHLNQASESELLTLLAGLGIDYGTADRVAQAVSDWKDADDFPRGRGAEREDYLDANALVLPSNRPFAEINELRYVVGVTDELFATVTPYVTLFGTGRININKAPLEVLRTVPGMSEGLLAGIFEARREGRFLSSVLDAAIDLPPHDREDFDRNLATLIARTEADTREVQLISDGYVEGSPVRVRVEALLLRSGDMTFLVNRGTR